MGLELRDLLDETDGWYGYFLQHRYPFTLATKNYSFHAEFPMIAKGMDAIVYFTLLGLGAEVCLSPVCRGDASR